MRSRALNIPTFKYEYKFWKTKPYRFKLWFLNIHFYRSPSALGSSLFKNDKYLLTWEEWERRIKKVCPLQFYFRNEVPSFFRSIKYSFRYKISDPIRAFFKKITNPNNVIKIDTLGVYASESELILHSLFKILCDHVDKRPQDIYILNETPQLEEWWNQTQALYKYWKIERPNILKKIEEAMNLASESPRNIPYHEKYAKLIALEKALEEKDTAALEFIVRTREQFWT